MKIVLQTPRLVLREFSLDDASEIFRINSDPEIVRYAEGVVPSSIDETLDHLRAGPLADYADRGYGRWAVLERAAGQLVGMCGPKLLPALGEVEIGYRIQRDRWGRGYATEAAAAARDYARDILGLDHVIALIMEANAASIRVAEKLGMSCTGPMTFEGTRVLRYQCVFS